DGFLDEGDVPELDRLVSAGRGQGLAIGAVRHGPERVALPVYRDDIFAAGYLPQLDQPGDSRGTFRVSVKTAARNDGLAVGAERHAGDIPRVLAESAGVLAAAHVPQFDRRVGTPRSQQLAVGTEGHGVDR